VIDHVLEDVPAYAVGALDRAELARMEEHLRECAGCRAEVYSASEVAASIPLALDRVEPGPELKSRILAAARVEPAQPEGLDALKNDNAALRAPSQTQSDVPASPSAQPLPFRRTPRSRAPFYAVSLLAAAAVVVFALGATLGHLLQPSASPQRQYAQLLASAVSRGDHVDGLITAAGVKVKSDMAIALAPSGATSLIVGPTTSPPRGKVYQIWYIRDKQPTSLGVLRPNPSEARIIDLSRSARGYQIAAMTVEPAPDGSAKGPTSTPFVTASLSS
jgi:anti-sigma-K factor RskA